MSGHKLIFVGCAPLGTGSGAVTGSTRGGDVLGFALAQDGTGLAEHLSSNASYAKHDLGLTSDWQHEKYRAHYPDGYWLVWVDDPASHVDYQAALALNRAKHKAAELAAIGGAR